MDPILIMDALVLFSQMEDQNNTIVMVMDITEFHTLGGNNVAFGMKINVNQRVTNANTFFWSKLDLECKRFLEVVHFKKTVAQSSFSNSSNIKSPW